MTGSFYFNFAVIVIAISSVAIASTLYWVAKNLIASTISLKNLIEKVDNNVNHTVEMLQESISDINTVTKTVGEQMDQLEDIVQNANTVSKDVRATTFMINKTVTPTLANLHGLTAGLKKAVDTWNDYGDTGKNPDSEES